MDVTKGSESEEFEELIRELDDPELTHVEVAVDLGLLPENLRDVPTWPGCPKALHYLPCDCAGISNMEKRARRMDP